MKTYSVIMEVFVDADSAESAQRKLQEALEAFDALSTEDATEIDVVSVTEADTVKL